jgi:hypothetical protein
MVKENIFKAVRGKKDTFIYRGISKSISVDFFLLEAMQVK